MLGTRRFLFGGLALCALLVGAVNAPLSSGDTAGRSSPRIAVFSGGPISGMVMVRPTGRTTARAKIALHGLATDKSYAVTWVDRPCSTRVAPPSAGASVAIETIQIAHEGFITRPIARVALRAKSVRVWEGDTVRACRPYQSGSAESEAFAGKLGIVLATQARGATRTKGYVSLHGLRPDTRYRVIASKNPCSKPHTTAALVLGLIFRTSEDNVFFPYTVNTPLFGPRSGRAAASAQSVAKSVRVVFKRPSGSSAELTCLVGLGSYIVNA